MELLTKIRNLLLVGLVAVLVLAVVPVQTIRAGEYVEDEDHFGYGDEEEDESGDNSSKSSTVSYSSGDLETSCVANSYATAWANYGASGSFEAMFDAESWAIAYHSWSWTGGGTPTGGTLEYSYDVGGLCRVDGTTFSHQPYSSASSSSKSDTDTSNVDSESGGFVNDDDMGYAASSIEPSGAGSTNTEVGYGHYHSYASLSLSVEDEEEISEGTAWFWFVMSSDCYGIVYAKVNTSGLEAYATAGATSQANASGDATFTANE